jgi:phosphoglucosamine mutase
MSHPRLFGTDGIRGIAGEYPLEKMVIRKLGAAAAAVYREHVSGRKPLFLLGRDTRGSGPWIAQAFAEGAATQKVDIVDAGVISTPSLAYLVPKRKVLGGVMISASHNPAAFNGIKLFNPFGRKCPDAWEQEIEQRIHELAPPPALKPRLRKDATAVKDYLAFLRRTLPPHTSFKGLKLVVDCSHGSLSAIAPRFLRSLGAQVIAIGASPTGKNINAGWGSQQPEKMQKLVVARKAHGGLAFDGDADRIIFCDEFGRLLDGDFILACAAHSMKEEKRLTGNTVVVTVMANFGLMKALESWQVQTLATPVGDRYVSDMLEERGCSIGGEQSGHIIFHDHLPTGDGLLTALQVLSMLRRRHRPLSWVYSLFKRTPQILLNVHVKVKKPLEDCPTIQREIENARQELADQGRVVVRYSGTEPLLRIMMEGPHETRLKALAGKIASTARDVLGTA